MVHTRVKVYNKGVFFFILHTYKMASSHLYYIMYIKKGFTGIVLKHGLGIGD